MSTTNTLPPNLGPSSRRNFELTYDTLIEEHRDDIIVRCKIWGDVKFYYTEIYGHNPKRKTISMPLWTAEQKGLRGE